MTPAISQAAIAPWEANPSWLVSLWDMILYSNRDFETLGMDINEIRNSLETNTGRFTKQDAEYYDSRTRKVVERAEEYCKRYGLEAAMDRVKHIKHEMSFGMVDPTELKVLWESMEDQMVRSKFAYVPRSKSRYLDPEQTFGAQVLRRFPSAKSDMESAGQAHAVGLNTACVLHLVRVTERGLKALAAERGLTSRVPPDYREWGEIIGDIEESAKKITQGWRRGPEREAVADFYDSCTSNLRHFKTIWRDRSVHGRSGIHTDEDTAKAIGYAVEFMKRVSARISESRCNPLKWKTPP
jgi:hypothetical protein